MSKFVVEMTKQELVARLHDIEWEDFEVKTAKSELTKDVWESISAFSNTSGGWIVLGVNQNGKKFEIQGVDNIEKLEQDFFSAIRSNKFHTQLFPRPQQFLPLRSAIQRKAEDNHGANDGAKKMPRQEAILALMANNPEITLDEIAKEIGVGTSTIDRELAKMAHLVRRIGSKHGGHWEILK